MELNKSEKVFGRYSSVFLFADPANESNYDEAKKLLDQVKPLILEIDEDSFLKKSFIYEIGNWLTTYKSIQNLFPNNTPTENQFEIDHASSDYINLFRSTLLRLKKLGVSDDIRAAVINDIKKSQKWNLYRLNALRKRELQSLDESSKTKYTITPWFTGYGFVLEFSYGNLLYGPIWKLTHNLISLLNIYVGSETSRYKKIIHVFDACLKYVGADKETITDRYWRKIHSQMYNGSSFESNYFLLCERLSRDLETQFSNNMKDWIYLFLDCVGSPIDQSLELRDQYKAKALASLSQYDFKQSPIDQIINTQHLTVDQLIESISEDIFDVPLEKIIIANKNRN